MQDLPQKISQVEVSIDTIPSGVITSGSHFSFQPLSGGKHVSLTMQRPGLTPFDHGVLHPIFSQNLPEGYNRRYIADRLARYANVDDMYLLALQGEYGIGMLSYRTEQEFPAAEKLSIDDILKYKGEKPLFPQLLEKYYLRNMVSGVQPKVILSIDSMGRSVEQQNVIVKAADSNFPLLTVNEYVCMEAARACHLDVPNTYLADNLETFIIERFDNIDGIAYGYEDFTTLMKKSNSTDAKYQSSYETLLRAVMLFTNSIKEVEKTYSYIVFNCLIGNGDAHLKNFALQYSPDMKHIFVSPLFDVTHTQIYAHKYHVIDNKMALKLNKTKQFPDHEQLLRLGIEAGIPKIKVLQVIENLADGIVSYLNQSTEVLLFDGLKESIMQSVFTGTGSKYNTKNYNHDRRMKYE